MLPDSPEARLGFAKAMLDFGRVRIVKPKKPNVRRLAYITHAENAPLRLLSKSLNELGIKNRLTIYGGNQALRVPGTALPLLKAKVGFRNPKKQRQLS